MKTLKEIANDLDAVASKMKQTADDMAKHGAEFEAIGEHATELAGAARIARGWAKELRGVK
jgi:hypothetical protein